MHLSCISQRQRMGNPVYIDGFVIHFGKVEADRCGTMDKQVVTFGEFSEEWFAPAQSTLRHIARDGRYLNHAAIIGANVRVAVDEAGYVVSSGR